MIFQYASLILSMLYAAIILFFSVGIWREKRRQQSDLNRTNSFVTVMVPARNEAAHITTTLASLAEQDYPAEMFEVLVIDDRSTDATAAQVESFIREKKLPHFRLIRYEGRVDRRTYKKNALAHAIPLSRGEIILTTDADCRIQPGWIRSMVEKFTPETGMVAGLITFDDTGENRLFHTLQSLEFAGLVFSGVGAIGNRYPLICNGSNLGYRRAAYDDVGGFAGHAHIPSGDDDLFMQELHRHTDWEIRYNLDPRSINYTLPVEKFSQFINQRARWGSKSRDYPGVLTFIILLSIYTYYVLLLLSPLWLALGWISQAGLLTVWALKVVPELSVLIQGLSILKRLDLIRYYSIALPVQVPYIVIAGFAGFFKLFRWK